MDEDFQFLQPLDLITKDAEELQKIIKEKKESLQRDKPRGKNKDVENDPGLENAPSKGKEREKQQRDKEQDREKTDKDKERDKGKEKEKVQEGLTEIRMGGDKLGSRHDENGHGEGNLHVLFFCIL